MHSSMLLSIITFVYALASVLYIGSWTFKKEGTMAKIGLFVLVTGFAGNTLGILLRWIESYQVGYGHAPFSNMYESLIFFSWTVAALYLFVEYKYKERTIGAFTTPLIFLAIAYRHPSEIRLLPLIPALKSNWLIAHVITCFLGYAGFAVAFGFGIMYLVKPDTLATVSLMARLPSLDVIDELIHQMVMFGFLFLTIHHHGGRVGQLCLGYLFVMGPQGDLVAYYMAYLRYSAPFAYDEGMAWQANFLGFHYWIHGRAFHLFRGKSAPRSPQLCMIRT